MRYATTAHFDRAFDTLATTKAVQAAFFKQIDFLLHDIRHPSLRAKKYDEVAGVWQMRVTNSVRAYFLIVGGTYLFVNIRKHKD